MFGYVFCYLKSIEKFLISDKILVEGLIGIILSLSHPSTMIKNSVFLEQ